jgi:ThiF family protein/E2/UBC family protein A
VDGRLAVVLSMRLGPMEKRDGGLELKEREEFILIVPPDFPFDYPTLRVEHERFASFPHVVWAKIICLYQSKLEWNPADGLYGFFDRLGLWLGRAAMNDMDPIEGPLEPPHHITDFSQVPFVIRSNAPVAAGQPWFGLAELEKHPNRLELVGWNDWTQAWPQGKRPALAVFLPQPLPMEFPQRGGDFFRELERQGLDRDQILSYLALAAFLTRDGDPLHLVLGIPMRRATDGSLRVHIAVWTLEPDSAKDLRLTLPAETDTESLRSLKKELGDLLYSIFELQPIKWCQVMEDRTEIVVRRDAGRPVSWFRGRKVLVLGCGALGSWAAEIISRANPSLIHLVDHSIVKPGLLARQNYRLKDIGSNKAEALADRLEGITQQTAVAFFGGEAHRFITQDTAGFGAYDVAIDCTASAIFQMKLERDWATLKLRTPPVVSMVIDAKATHALGVALGASSPGGIWDAYVRLKYKMSLDGSHQKVVTAFYSERATQDLFQPEPGCSDPTFSGSTADALTLISTFLNLAMSEVAKGVQAVGIAVSAHSEVDSAGSLDIVQLPIVQDALVDQYRIRISPNVYREAQAWVRQNTRQRSPNHETGGLLWGLWDDAAQVIWVLDASGPPPDSLHDPAHFVCGVQGTLEEHKRRLRQSHGACGFVGMWHTHPDMPSDQSVTDLVGMTDVVSTFGQNRKRAIMVIFGRYKGEPTAGVYVYESQMIVGHEDLVSVMETQIPLWERVV